MKFDEQTVIPEPRISANQLKRIVIFIDYFGVWPKWFPAFLASCRYNATINWIIRTDCKIPPSPPVNVKFIQVSYRDYVHYVSSKLGINFNPAESYKLCDLRPTYGDLYYDDMAGFDFFGFGDLDVIYGDIRRFYNDEVLEHDVISTHVGMLSGHLSLFRNIRPLRKAYLKIPDWRTYLECPHSTRFDEDIYSCLFVKQRNRKIRRLMKNPLRSSNFKAALALIARGHIAELFRYKGYFKEQYTTVFHPIPWHDGSVEHPSTWYWRPGSLTNATNVGREYLYLHLMNFQSMRWTNPECRSQRTSWRENPEAVFEFCVNEADGVQIDWNGIQPIDPIRSQRHQTQAIETA